MANRPVGVVAQSVHRFDRHHGSFESGHTVEGQRHDQET